MVTFCLQKARQVWLAKWDSSKADPDSKDEQAMKSYLSSKYEKRRWYEPPEKVLAKKETEASPAPEVKVSGDLFIFFVSCHAIVLSRL